MLNACSSVSKKDGKVRTEKKIVIFYPYISAKASKEVEKIIKSRWIGQGQVVAEFEEKFKEVTGVPFAVAVNNVSSAIRLALALSGVNPGDEVITSAQTCTATNHPILEQYATPVFADIQYMSGNINPKDIEKRITEKTKAILCTHWGGYPCDLEEIHATAKKHNLPIIEDASDAMGARYKSKPVGSISPFTCFSFQAIQQITTAEGGMLCTLEEEIFDAAQRRRWYGIDRIQRKPNVVGYFDFDVWETGYGYHMTNIAAAIGLANLEEFESIKNKRQKIAKKYREALCKLDGITLFEEKSDRSSAHQLFTIHVRDREKFCQALRSRGIETSIVHKRNDVYTVFGGLRNDLPHLDHFTKTNISIPLHNQLSDEDVDYVIEIIKKGW